MTYTVRTILSCGCSWVVRDAPVKDKDAMAARRGERVSCSNHDDVTISAVLAHGN